MGYSTDFFGKFHLDCPLTKEQNTYLTKFGASQRMKRNPEILKGMPDPLREAVGLPIGEDGEFFVGEGSDESIKDQYTPPRTQPSSWCQWTPGDDGKTIVWDEGESFKEYIAWIKYLIKNFFKPWGYVLNGEVEWRGAEYEDRGKIVIEDNRVIIFKTVTSFEEDYSYEDDED